MLGDLWQLILQSIEFLWPYKIIKQWEGGVYLIFGRYMWMVGPGLHPVVPWFFTIHETTMAWDPVETEHCDITTKDLKSTLAFSAKAMCRVVDVKKAIMQLHNADTSARALLEGILSEKLAEVDPERFSPDKRNRLNTDLRKWATEELLEYGMEVQWVRFSTFVLNPKMFRLLGGSVLHV